VEFDAFEWDDAKNERTRTERGFGFAFACLVFDDLKALTIDTERSDNDDEQRLMTVGRIGASIFAVVWTPRESARRIISARLASRRERQTYDGDRPR